MREIWARIRYLFRRDAHARHLRDELDSHIQMEIDANMERGLSPDEARSAARRSFGSPARVLDSAHDTWMFPWLESVLQDIRYSLRQIRKSPGLCLAVVGSLAIGLGANTAIFSLIDAAALRPLPVADPGRLVQLEWRNDRMPAGAAILLRAPAQMDTGLQSGMISGPLLRGFSAEQNAFVSVIGYLGTTDEVAITALSGAPAQQVRRHYVSQKFFDGLGATPALGRSFLEEEDRPGAEPAIIVSHRFWSSRLGADPDVIGRSVRINDQPARIVGVAPAGFFGLNRGEWIDIYQPLDTHPFFRMQQQGRLSPSAYWSVSMMARLAPGVSASAAATAMTPLFRNLVAETTGTEVEDGLELIASPAGRGQSWTGRQSGAVDDVSQALWILMLLVGVLLLIVCANVANLLLSRSVKRRRESAVRLALGAGRRRLVRQHLVESGMLAVLGGAAGLALGTVLARSIHALFQTGRGPGDAFAVILDWRLAVYAAGISMLTALIFGLAPAWAAARSKVNDALKAQSRSVLGSGLRVPRILVSAQFALSFAALVAAGLLGRSLGNLYSTDLGFDSEHLSYATVHPSQAGFTFERRGPYMERLKQEIAAIPGVVAVAPLERRPLDGGGSGSYVSAPHGPPATGEVWLNNPAARTSVMRGAPGFIEALGIAMLRGRTLEPRDACALPEAGATGRPVCPVVVDERFAEVFFPKETPVGQRFEMPAVTPPYDYEVVGLVANIRHGVLREEAVPTMYYLGPAGFPLDHLAIRSRVDPSALATAVRQAVARIDPAVPLAEFHTQSGLIDRLLRTERLLALVSGAFSMAALGLAAVGLGGLLAYTVARRTNEIGIRIALGATSDQLRRMILVDSLWMVGVGILFGAPAAWGVGRYLQGRLFRLTSTDPSTALLALLALIAIAGVASIVPAVRAARVSPLTALREE